MTNGMSGADISSLLYVKSNTFKIERKKKKEMEKKQTKKKKQNKKRFSICNTLY